MSNPFFDHPILNSPYEYPSRHWELDKTGQPTQKTIDSRRRADERADQGNDGRRLEGILGGHREAAEAEARKNNWPVEIAGHVDPAPVGRPILDEAGLDPGQSYADIATMLAGGNVPKPSFT